jgi:hypothetical protein
MPKTSNMPRLESAKTRKVPRLESAKTGKCQDWKVPRPGKCQDWKVPRPGKYHHWKVPKSAGTGHLYYLTSSPEKFMPQEVSKTQQSASGLQAPALPSTGKSQFF